MPPQPVTSQPAHGMLGWALLPLRAFLGFTFCYAGLQKLANPGFFDATNPISIQAQLAGAARRSPVHALISPLGHVAVALGVLIALGEFAVGVGTLLGLWARIAAAGGIVLSFLLFLTVSFHSAPYYTGADIVFVFAWTPLLLAGAGSVLSLDAMIASRSDQQTTQVRRRAVLTGMMAAAASMAVAAFAAGVGRLAHGTSSGKSATAGLSSPTATQGSPTATSSPSPGSAAGTPAGTAIGPSKDVPVGQAAAFTDPRTGDPSLVIQPKAGVFVAFDAVCPHAGCTVQYDPSANVIACPCHGSQFNAATGAVEVGPAATGLRKIPITDGQNGQLFVG